jgi:hypothetical protein
MWNVKEYNAISEALHDLLSLRDQWQRRAYQRRNFARDSEMEKVRDETLYALADLG